MSTKLYFRDIASDEPSYPSAYNITTEAPNITDFKPLDPSDKMTVMGMSTSKGAAQVSIPAVCNNEGDTVNYKYVLYRIFKTSELEPDQVITGSQTWSCGIAVKESHGNANVVAIFSIYILRGDTVVKWLDGHVTDDTEHGTSETGCLVSFTGAGGNYTTVSGDRIVVEVWLAYQNTRSTDYTGTIYYDGTTDVADGIGTTDAAAFLEMPVAFNFVDPYTFNVPTADIFITAQNPTFDDGSGNVTVNVPIATISTTVYAPGYGVGTVAAVPVLDVSIRPRDAIYIWDIPISRKVQPIYTCTLTGEADGEDDLELPTSIIYGSLKDGVASRLSCHVPGILNYQDDIADRANGDIVIRYGYRGDSSGIANTEIIARAPYQNLQIVEQSNGAAALLTGSESLAVNAAVKERTLSGVRYYGITESRKRKLRTSVDMFLKPGDVAVYEDDSFQAGNIFYAISPKDAYMEVEEK